MRRLLENYRLEIEGLITLLVAGGFAFFFAYTTFTEYYTLSELEKGWVQTTAVVTKRGFSHWRGKHYWADYRYAVTLPNGETQVFTGRDSISGGAYGGRADEVKIIYAQSDPSVSRVGASFEVEWWDRWYTNLPAYLFIIFGFGCVGVPVVILGYWFEKWDRKRSAPVSVSDVWLSHARWDHDEGLTFYHSGDFKRAIARYDVAIMTYPAYAEAYKNRGVAYSALKDHKQALKDFKQYLHLMPDALDRAEIEQKIQTLKELSRWRWRR